MITFFITGLILFPVSFIHLSPVNSYRFRSLSGIGIFCILLSLGMFRLNDTQPAYYQSEGVMQTLTFRINSIPQEKNNSWQYTATLLTATDSLQTPDFQNEIHQLPAILYLRKDSLFSHPRKGDVIVCHSTLQQIRNSGNPDEFDYSSFMLRKGFRYSCFIPKYKVIATLPIDSFIMQHADKFRAQILERLKQMFPDKTTRGFIAAILLGEKQEIPNEIREDFSRNGLSHILAVSGLHTGILFMLVYTLLWPLRLLRLQKIIFPVTIVIMWGYAMLTGFTPSVNRAVCMISVLLIARFLAEKNSPLNALFLTAFVMLLIKPAYLFDIGFQLSFLAVLSIFIYLPVLQQLTAKSNSFIRHGCDILFLSTSAQILTLPVSLYYFHILPVWFLASNLLVIPLLTPLLLLIILNLILNSLGFQIGWITGVTHELTELILNISAGFAALPQSTPLYPDGIYLTGTYLVIIAATLFILHRSARYLIATLSILCLITAYTFFNENRPEPEIILFNQRKANTIHIFTENQHLIYSPDSGFHTGLTHPFHRPHQERKRIRTATLLYPDTTSCLEGIPSIRIYPPFISIGNKRFCLLTDNRFARHTTENPVPTDYLVLGGRFYGTLHETKALFRYREVILLPTLSARQRERLIPEADSLQIPLYDVSRNGAFRLTIIAK